MKTIQKILIVIGFATAPIVLSATWNLQANGEIQLLIAVAVVTFIMSWIAVRFIEVAFKSIK